MAQVIPFPERRRSAQVVALPSPYVLTPAALAALERLPDDPNAREEALDLIVLQLVSDGIVPPLPSPFDEPDPPGAA